MNPLNQPPPPPEDRYFFFFSQKCPDCRKFYDQLPELSKDILDAMEGYEISTGMYPPELRRVPAVMTEIYFHDEGRFKRQLLQGAEAFLWFNNVVVVSSDHDGGGEVRFSFIQDEQRLSAADVKTSVFLDEREYQNQKMRLTPDQIISPLTQSYHIQNPNKTVITGDGTSIPQTHSIHQGVEMPDIVPQGQKLPSLNVNRQRASDLNRQLESTLANRDIYNYRQQQQMQPGQQLPPELRAMRTRVDNSTEFNAELERAISMRRLPQQEGGYVHREALQPMRVGTHGNSQAELDRILNQKLAQRTQEMQKVIPRLPHQRRKPVYRPPQQQRRYYPQPQQQPQQSQPQQQYQQQQQQYQPQPQYQQPLYRPQQGVYVPPHRRY